MLVRRTFLLAIACLLAVGLTACSKKTGVAIVVEKEHIDARAPDPTPSPGVSPAAAEGPVVSEMTPGEIAVDDIVMQKELRGTSKDPRAMHDEQWLVKVEMVEVSRRFNIHTDRAHYDKVNVGDRIKVRYAEGKYTGTVWGSEIVE